MTNITFLAEGRLAPSTRFRVLQFLPAFEAAGLRTHVIYAYGSSYNRIAATRLGAAYKMACRLKRIGGGLLAPRDHIIFSQRPLLPFSSAGEGLIRAGHPRVIFDVDDAVFVGPRGEDRPLRRRAFDGAVRHAAHVICGNQWLAAEAGAPEKTTVIPTVIDTDRYRPGDKKRNEGKVVIGWIGSATTLWHIEAMLPLLRRLRDGHPQVVVRVVCSAPPAGFSDEERFEFVPWSKEGELSALQSFDIGLMPLENKRVSLGKCAFKMIQYMACGIAVVASPVGANTDVFAGSEAGFLASSDREWREALERLISDDALRSRCGASGRAHAEGHYSVRAVVPQYLRIFETLHRTSR